MVTRSKRGRTPWMTQTTLWWVTLLLFGFCKELAHLNFHHFVVTGPCGGVSRFPCFCGPAEGHPWNVWRTLLCKVSCERGIQSSPIGRKGLSFSWSSSKLNLNHIILSVFLVVVSLFFLKPSVQLNSSLQPPKRRLSERSSTNYHPYQRLYGIHSYKKIAARRNND